MSEAEPHLRRRRNTELKERVLAECDAPGASVTRVAMAHGLNTHLVHKWRRLARPGTPVATNRAGVPQFVPVDLSAAAKPRADIRVELRRGPTTITVTWPIAAAAELGIWMRELLR